MIFFIDDDEDLVTVVCRYLRAQRYPQLGFTDAAAALQALQEFSATQKKLIIVDFTMAGTRPGKALWQELVAQQFKPLMIITGHTEDHPHLMSLERYDIAGILHKPVPLQTLIDWAAKFKILPIHGIQDS